ncbi:MAG: hypothetical protein D6776_03335 [Planctomycetota bacterium]|nr:MAG: hypothetical protein D6776_03335 [Planctomycetota bacterium]
MAGIGFRLRELTGDGGIVSTVAAYGYAAVLSAGPWLITITVIAALSVFAPVGVGESELALFRALIVHVYMVTLVSTGPVQMVASRYLADRLWVHDVDAVAPAYALGLVGVTTLHALGGALVVWALGMPPGLALGAVGLLVVVAAIWYATTFLSAAKEYVPITVAFAMGGLVSVVAAIWIGRPFGAAGMVYGYLVGQLLTLALLSGRVYVEFGGGRLHEPGFVAAWRTYSDLALTGLFYSAGIWIDKVVFAYSPLGMQLPYGLRSNPGYESAIFLAYLSTIPTLALFLIRVETGFYEAYRGFFAAILARAPLGELLARRREIEQRLRLSVGRVLRLQAAVTAVAILFAPQLLDVLGFDPLRVQLFRVGCVAAMLQVLLLLVLLGLLYLEQRRAALWLSALFVAGNGFGSAATLHADPSWYGTGYALACLVPLVLGYLRFDAAASDLVADTFLRQPIAPEPEAEAIPTGEPG